MTNFKLLELSKLHNVFFNVSISMIVIGLMVILYTYYDHTKRMINEKNEALRGHIRQHILIMNLLVIAIIAFFVGTFENFPLNQEVNYLYSIDVSLFLFGIFLAKLGLHLIRELKKDNNWVR